MPQTDSGTRVDPALAMVATSTNRLPDALGVLAACGLAPARAGGLIASLLGRKPVLPKEQQWNETNLVVACHGGHLAVSLMPAPIPWSSLEGPCATSWWWPQATAQMRGHKY